MSLRSGHTFKPTDADFQSKSNFQWCVQSSTEENVTMQVPKWQAKTTQRQLQLFQPGKGYVV